MDDYKIIVEQEHSTVMTHYEVAPKPDGGYQSGAQGVGTCTAGKEKTMVKRNLGISPHFPDSAKEIVFCGMIKY